MLGQLFASLNRDAMMENVVTALQSVTQKTVKQPQTLAMEDQLSPQLCAKRTALGEEIYVTRKGAGLRVLVNMELFPVRWGRKALSSVGWEMKSRSVRAATVPGG
ncbi:protein rtcB [Escherichia coli]|uniref:Protein rtcB n=1 Tax=Escherichia coli TaxID=562 RepID=A0A377JYK6_ECOLX|nr:protein rtcB [Escherichia coli]